MDAPSTVVCRQREKLRNGEEAPHLPTFLQTRPAAAARRETRAGRGGAVSTASVRDLARAADDGSTVCRMRFLVALVLLVVAAAGKTPAPKKILLPPTRPFILTVAGALLSLLRPFPTHPSPRHRPHYHHRLLFALVSFSSEVSFISACLPPSVPTSIPPTGNGP